MTLLSSLSMVPCKKSNQKTSHHPFWSQVLPNITPLSSLIIHSEECNSNITKTASIKRARINSSSISKVFSRLDLQQLYKRCQQSKINSLEARLFYPKTPSSSIREASISNSSSCKRARSCHQRKRLLLSKLFKE